MLIVPDVGPEFAPTTKSTGYCIYVAIHRFVYGATTRRYVVELVGFSLSLNVSVNPFVRP